MQRARNLEQTPSLIDADVADDVGNMRACVGVTASARRAKSPSGDFRPDYIVF
jgi:hypothetical protein